MYRKFPKLLLKNELNKTLCGKYNSGTQLQRKQVYKGKDMRCSQVTLAQRSDVTVQISLLLILEIALTKTNNP